MYDAYTIQFGRRLRVGRRKPTDTTISLYKWVGRGYGGLRLDCWVVIFGSVALNLEARLVYRLGLV